MKCWMQWTKAKLGKQECVWWWPVWWLTWQRNFNHQECSRFQGFKKSQEIIWGSQTQKLKKLGLNWCVPCCSHSLKGNLIWLSLGKNYCYLATTYLPFCFSPPPEVTVFCLQLPLLSEVIHETLIHWEETYSSDLQGCFHPWIASLGEAFSTKPGAHKRW